MDEKFPMDANQPAWRQRAVFRSLNAAKSRAEQRFSDSSTQPSIYDEKGTTDFTIQEVLDRSKQSLRGFYQYFDGKDELLLTLRRDHREASDDLAQSSPSESDPFVTPRLRDPPARVV